MLDYAQNRRQITPLEYDRSARTDRFSGRRIRGEVHAIKRDGVALEYLSHRGLPPTVEHVEFTHLRPRKGQPVSELLRLLD